MAPSDGHILICMATPSIKSTYTFDIGTVRRLESMAARWGVSKSEALRRAIRLAADPRGSVSNEVLEAWNEVQEALALSPAKSAAWARTAREERRASSSRRTPGKQ